MAPMASGEGVKLAAEKDDPMSVLRRQRPRVPIVDRSVLAQKPLDDATRRRLPKGVAALSEIEAKKDIGEIQSNMPPEVAREPYLGSSSPNGQAMVNQRHYSRHDGEVGHAASPAQWGKGYPAPGGSFGSQKRGGGGSPRADGRLSPRGAGGGGGGGAAGGGPSGSGAAAAAAAAAKPRSAEEDVEARRRINAAEAERESLEQTQTSLARHVAHLKAKRVAVRHALTAQRNALNALAMTERRRLALRRRRATDLACLVAATHRGALRVEALERANQQILARLEAALGSKAEAEAAIAAALSAAAAERSDKDKMIDGGGGGCGALPSALGVWLSPPGASEAACAAAARRYALGSEPDNGDDAAAPAAPAVAVDQHAGGGGGGGDDDAAASAFVRPQRSSLKRNAGGDAKKGGAGGGGGSAPLVFVSCRSGPACGLPLLLSPVSKLPDRALAVGGSSGGGGGGGGGSPKTSTWAELVPPTEANATIIQWEDRRLKRCRVEADLQQVKAVLKQLKEASKDLARHHADASASAAKAQALEAHVRAEVDALAAQCALRLGTEGDPAAQAKGKGATPGSPLAPGAAKAAGGAAPAAPAAQGPPLPSEQQAAKAAQGSDAGAAGGEAARNGAGQDGSMEVEVPAAGPKKGRPTPPPRRNKGRFQKPKK